MKRSEMVNLIIRDLIDTKNSGVDFQARMVLARIESCGMLPLERNTSYFCDCGHPEIEYQYCWDKEDEEN
jgi:hypothetical protein